MRSTREAYEAAFKKECANEYPIIDEFERSLGYKINRDTLEEIALDLACPVKKNPPCWQHGRVLYAAAREYLARNDEPYYHFLDIGTAKGFSALCVALALAHSHKLGQVVSVDVIDPYAKVDRNSIMDPLTVPELVHHWWPTWIDRLFIGMTGEEYLATLADSARIHFAFVDGKHDFKAVLAEGHMIARHQEAGDIAIFDDVHVPGVHRAIQPLPYEFQYIRVLPNRAYAVGVRR